MGAPPPGRMWSLSLEESCVRRSRIHRHRHPGSFGSQSPKQCHPPHPLDDAVGAEAYESDAARKNPPRRGLLQSHGHLTATEANAQDPASSAHPRAPTFMLVRSTAPSVSKTRGYRTAGNRVSTGARIRLIRCRPTWSGSWPATGRFVTIRTIATKKRRAQSLQLRALGRRRWCAVPSRPQPASIASFSSQLCDRREKTYRPRRQ